MRELLSINLFFIFLIFLNCTSSRQLNDKILKADSLILSTLNLKNLPGISVTILKDGINIYSKGIGYADIEKKTKIIPSETRFRIGSVSKTIASSALMKLVEEKKVNLDSSIYNYVPDYPKKRWEFTSRQIAGHLSGIRGYRDNEMMIDKNFTNVSDALEIFKLDSLMHEPNSKYLYSTHALTRHFPKYAVYNFHFSSQYVSKKQFTCCLTCVCVAVVVEQTAPKLCRVRFCF